MKQTRKIEWRLKDTGRKACVTIAFATSKTVDADGYKTEVPCAEISITGEVDGSLVGWDVQRIGHPLVAGRCGKLGIPEAQMKEIEAAIAEFEGSAEWVAKQAQIEKNQKEIAELEADRAKWGRNGWGE